MPTSTKGGAKDFIILAHIYLYCATIMTLAFKHPEPSIVIAAFSTVSGLLGFTHWFLIEDDKKADAA